MPGDALALEKLPVCRPGLSWCDYNFDHTALVYEFNGLCSLPTSGSGIPVSCQPVKPEFHINNMFSFKVSSYCTENTRVHIIPTA